MSSPGENHDEGSSGSPPEPTGAQGQPSSEGERGGADFELGPRHAPIVYTTGKEIRDMIGRHGPNAPPDLKAIRAVSESDIRATTSKFTRRIWFVAAGLTMLGGGGVAGVLWNENRKRELSSVPFPHLNYEADLRDPGFLEFPEEQGARVVFLPLGKLTGLPWDVEEKDSAGGSYDFILESGDLRCELVSSRLVLKDDVAYHARLPEGRGIGSRLAVHQGHVEEHEALTLFPEELQSLSNSVTLQGWLRSEILWAFLDTIDGPLQRVQETWAREAREKIRERLTVNLPGFGPYCLADAAIYSPNGRSVLAILPVDGARMQKIAQEHDVPYTAPSHVVQRCVAVFDLSDDGSHVSHSWFVTLPLVSGVDGATIKFQPGKVFDLQGHEGSITSLLNRFPPPEEQPMNVPVPYVGLVGSRESHPHWPMYESILQLRHVLQTNSMWNQVTEFRKWEMAFAIAAKRCGAQTEVDIERILGWNPLQYQQSNK